MKNKEPNYAPIEISITNNDITEKNILDILNRLNDNNSILTPNKEDFIRALKVIKFRLNNNKISQDKAKEVIGHHIKQYNAYMLRNTIEREFKLLESNIRNGKAKEKIQFSDTLHTLEKAVFSKEENFLKESTNEVAIKLLKELDIKAGKVTAATLENMLYDRTARKNDLESVPIPTTKSVHKTSMVSSTNRHDYGKKFIYKPNQQQDSFIEKGEIILEYTADILSRNIFPTQISSIRLAGEQKNITGLRSKLIEGGVSYYKYSKEINESQNTVFSNVGSFISKSLILLDVDMHSNNGFVVKTGKKTNEGKDIAKLIKIDHGRSGWLNFNNTEDIRNFIKDRYGDKSPWKELKYNDEDLLNSLASDLSKIDEHTIKTSFEEAAIQFKEMFPIRIPRINSMRNYNKLEWNLKKIDTPKEFVDYLSKKFIDQHNLLRTYVLEESLAKNIKIEGKNTIDYCYDRAEKGDIRFLEVYLNNYNKKLINLTKNKITNLESFKETILTCVNKDLEHIPILKKEIIQNIDTIFSKEHNKYFFTKFLINNPLINKICDLMNKERIINKIICNSIRQNLQNINEKEIIKEIIKDISQKKSKNKNPQNYKPIDSPIVENRKKEANQQKI